MKICSRFPEKVALDAEAAAVSFEQTKLVRRVGVPDRDEWDMALEEVGSAVPMSFALAELAGISGEMCRGGSVTAALGSVPG